MEVKAAKASLFGSSLLLLLLYLLFERERKSNDIGNNDELPERCYLLSWRCFNWLALRVAQYKVSLVSGFKLGGSSIWDKFSSVQFGSARLWWLQIYPISLMLVAFLSQLLSFLFLLFKANSIRESCSNLNVFNRRHQPLTTVNPFRDLSFSFSQS